MTTGKLTDHHEEGVEVPYEQINPDTLRNLIGEFVTREWEEGEVSYTLDQKIEQVLGQLREGTAQVVFDAASESCNIVPCRS
ncbi:YheU family protein [Geobacter sp. FeAm09]|uniref:YheU family protein n=1 Tax=Geobacter sp. FeAm09 TaxID=2597769 RepID=UPI0011ED8DC6|nr:YheU family protein [Geobacter sp. FeAm09]QEM69534.1 YheU family protein [Geobacter sp. FeAm09]